MGGGGGGGITEERKERRKETGFNALLTMVVISGRRSRLRLRVKRRRRRRKRKEELVSDRIVTSRQLANGPPTAEKTSTKNKFRQLVCSSIVMTFLSGQGRRGNKKKTKQAE